MNRHVPLSEQPVAASGDTPVRPSGDSRHVDPDLGFDPDSPDLADPQVDPPHPPHAPEDGPDPRSQRRVPDDRYPPYSQP
ncbi:hypothetical protein KW851_22180 [Pseudomonas sp. PDM33]|uniref:DUF6021 family protein n=1 Tax=unclassified Pseudomonas TaxID=196821 RepID=UPI0009E29AF3|nr:MULTISPECIES: DUF6021 family protein [unclassified Pseudomonas]MBV7585557.1 hypothetical protein [Pseudomonas sp. PDM33]